VEGKREMEGERGQGKGGGGEVGVKYRKGYTFVRRASWVHI
jgi:hypothetical protein